MSNIIRKYKIYKLTNSSETTDGFIDIETKEIFDFIQNILDKLEMKKSKKYTDSIFYFIEDKCYLEIKNPDLWCRYPDLWEVLTIKYLLNYDDTQFLIKSMVEEHFKSKCLTPFPCTCSWHDGVEEHFKLNSLTPSVENYNYSCLVEDHFKLK